MKKALITTVAILILAVPFFAVVTPHIAHANILSSIGMGYSDIVMGVVAWLLSWISAAVQLFLTATATLLNATLVMTLNMKALVDNVPAIGLVWRTIRDFSSIFIIFLLLYASIMMILGIDSGKDYNLGTLIKNIIIAGLFINFSMFMTKVIIDTSNLVSLSFYSAMVPSTSMSTSAGTLTSGQLAARAFDTGGLSNVFMQNLQIQTIASSKSALKGADTDFKISLAYLGQIVLMMMAAFSFIFAAVAFTVRIGMLIFLMAFSPIYFVAMIVPQAKEYAEKWKSALFGLSLFMPVYLFLMYVAVSILNDKNFFNFLNPANSNDSSFFGANTVGIVLQYVIAMFMINAPLLAAIEVGGKGAKLATDWGNSAKKWGQGFVGQHTVGRTARKISDSEAFGDFARRNPNLATLIDKNILEKGAKASYGGIKGTNYDKRVKEYTESLVKTGEKAKFNRPESKVGRLLNGRIPYISGRSYDDTVKNYEGDTSVLEKRLEARKKILEAQSRGGTMSEPAKKQLANETVKLSQEVERRKKVIAAGPDALAKETVAEKLEGNINPMTKDGRKDAAKKIRKNITKDKTEKLLEQLSKELAPKEKPAEGGGDEGKPKGEGGAKK